MKEWVYQDRPRYGPEVSVEFVHGAQPVLYFQDANGAEVSFLWKTSITYVAFFDVVSAVETGRC